MMIPLLEVRGQEGVMGAFRHQRYLLLTPGYSCTGVSSVAI